MFYLNKILVPTDSSAPLLPILRQALYLAKFSKAEVHLLHTVPPQDDALSETFQRVSKEAFAHALRNGHDLHQQWEQLASDVPIHHTLAHTPLAKRATLNYAAREDVDLILIGTQAQEGFDALFMDNIAEEITRKSPCPVLTLHVEDLAEAPVRQIRHLLVPTDFSDCSQHALMHAKGLAACFGAELTLLHVIQNKTLLHANHNPLLRHLIQSSMHPDFYLEQLQALYEAVPGPSGPINIHAVRGQATQEIATFTRDHTADLIVISSHGLTGVRHFSLGTTTEKIIRHAACPVFTVKAFQKSLVPARPTSFSQPSITSFTAMVFDILRGLPIPTIGVLQEQKEETEQRTQTTPSPTLLLLPDLLPHQPIPPQRKRSSQTTPSYSVMHEHSTITANEAINTP